MTKECKEIVIHCCKHFFGTRKPGNMKDAVAEMTGVSARSVVDVWTEHKKRVEEAREAGLPEEDVCVPPDEPDVRARESALKTRHLSYVTWCIHKIVYEDKLDEIPALRKLYDRVLELRELYAARHHLNRDHVFPFSYGTFHKAMGKLGYTHGNTGDERARLKTQQHVLEMRSQYLATIARLRAKGYLVLYQDETWVNKNTTKKKSWHRKVDKDGDFVPTDLPDNVAAQLPEIIRPGGKKPPIGKGGRAIVVGIGSSLTGTIPELLDIFRGKKSKTEDDYHKEMNATVFEEWFDRVIAWIKTNYPDRKVAVVIDNASYHSRAVPGTLVPTMSKTKPVIVNWMRTERVVPPQLLPGYLSPSEVQAKLMESLKNDQPFNYEDPKLGQDDDVPSVEVHNTLTKKQLVAAIPKRAKRYVVDEKAKENDIEVVRLPPYHCEFNPIELVWARAKAAVAWRNVKYKLKVAMEVMREEVEKCDAAYWAKLEQHAVKEEQKVILGDTLLNARIQRAIERIENGTDENDDLVVMLSLSSSGSSEASDSSDDDGDDATAAN